LGIAVSDSQAKSISSRSPGAVFITAEQSANTHAGRAVTYVTLIGQLILKPRFMDD